MRECVVSYFDDYWISSYGMNRITRKYRGANMTKKNLSTLSFENDALDEHDAKNNIEIAR
jgi:hypothetical protein